MVYRIPQLVSILTANMKDTRETDFTWQTRGIAAENIPLFKSVASFTNVLEPAMLFISILQRSHAIFHVSSANHVWQRQHYMMSSE